MHEPIIQFLKKCSHDHVRQSDRDDVMLTGQRELYIVLPKETNFSITCQHHFDSRPGESKSKA